MPLAPSTKLVSDVLTAVERQFGDESGAQVSTADIIRWVNDGQLEIVNRNKYNKTTATTTSIALQANYTFAGSNIVSVESVFYDNRPISNISFNEAQEILLRNTDPGGVPAPGIPYNWYEWDDTLYLYPPPDTTGKTILLYVVAQPPILTATTDALATPDIYFQALVQYCMTQAYEMDDDWTGAGNKLNQLDKTLAGLDKDGYSHQYYQTITVLQDDM
jgi:hypothetical protein